MNGLDRETIDLTIGAIKQFSEGTLSEERLLELDEKDEFPIDTIREMCANLGIHLLFIPEEYG